MNHLEYIWRMNRWNSLHHIWRYELRGWIEGGVGAFYFMTAGIGPALLGYCLGRWTPVYIRAIPLLFILPAGVWWTLNHDHWFEVYTLGNLLYAYSCARGLAQRAKYEQIAFWKLCHVDWILVATATVFMWVVYVLTMPKTIA